MPDDLSQIFDPQPDAAPMIKPRRRKRPVEAEAPASDIALLEPPPRRRRKSAEPAPDAADAPDISEKPRRRRSRSAAPAQFPEPHGVDSDGVGAAAAEPTVEVFVETPEPAPAPAETADQPRDMAETRHSNEPGDDDAHRSADRPLPEDSGFFAQPEDADLPAGDDSTFTQQYDEPVGAVVADDEISDPEEIPLPGKDEFAATVEDTETGAAAALADEASPVGEAEAFGTVEPTDLEEEFSLSEEDLLLEEVEFSAPLDEAEPVREAPDDAFSLSDGDLVPEDAEFSGVIQDPEPGAAGVFEAPAGAIGDDPPSASDAAPPGTAEAAIAEETCSFSAKPLNPNAFSDPDDDARMVAGPLQEAAPPEEEPPAEISERPCFEATAEEGFPDAGNGPVEPAAPLRERAFPEEVAGGVFAPDVDGTSVPEQEPVEPEEPLAFRPAPGSETMPGAACAAAATEVFEDVPSQNPPLAPNETEADGAAREELSMPRPLAPETSGDARHEPPIAGMQNLDEMAETPPLALEPLTEPPDNGPPLIPLDEAEPRPDDTEQGDKNAQTSKAWGPVRGAIETAMANIGPLLPISRAEQLRRQAVGAVQGQLAKISGLAEKLVFARLPWLKRIGAIVPRRRSTLVGGGLLVAAVAGGAGFRLLLSGAPAPMPAPIVDTPPLPSHVARRLGQELEMSVVSVPKGPTELFATGADQLDSALALSRREASGDGIVISLDALAGASRRVLAWYGLGASVTVKPSPGPTLTFQGEVPDALYPLAHAALDNIGQLLGRDPVLKTVQIRDQIAKSDAALLRAIFIGTPKSIVYTTDGAHEIGESLYGDFTIKAIDPDAVVLAPAQPGSKITVTVPLREPSAATVEGPPLAALPDRSAIVLMQQPRTAKE